MSGNWEFVTVVYLRIQDPMFRFLIAFVITAPVFGQHLANPSFEGTRQANIPPSPWTPCNEYSTPDTQPGFWGINATPTHGNSYVSLFTRGMGGFLNDGLNEGIGTPLAKPLKKDSCYIFSVDLAFFSKATFVGSFGDVVEYKYPTTLSISGGTSSCQKSIVLYQSGPINNEQWQTYSFSITPSADVNYLTLEANFVNGDRQYGCLLLDNIRIKSTHVDLGPDRVMCAGDVVTLTADSGNSNVMWSTGSTEKSLNITTPGEYSVKIAQDGCTAMDKIMIAFVPPINIDLGESKILCPGEIVVLNAASASATYQWSNGANSSSISVSNSGLYAVQVETACETFNDEVEIIVVDDYCCNLTAPNIFTPNDDGMNDVFEITSPSNLDQFQLKIYNRWGRIVFEGTDIANHWDGKNANGEPASSGVYFWVASINCSRNDLLFDKEYRGTVTLLK